MIDIPENWPGEKEAMKLLALLRLLDIAEPAFYIADRDGKKRPPPNRPSPTVRKSFHQLSVTQQKKRWPTFVGYVKFRMGD